MCKVRIVGSTKAHRIPYENVWGMVTWSSLRSGKPENVIPVLTVKWVHVSLFCQHRVELCKNLLALLVQLVTLGLNIYFLCFGAAAGEPSTQA